jgi:hypothetical protein
MGDGIGDFAFWLAVGLMSLGITFGPIGRALGRTVEAITGRLVGGGERPRAEALELAARREAELGRVEDRLLELEERLDFAERLLTSGRPGPGPGPEADTPPEPVESVR